MNNDVLNASRSGRHNQTTKKKNNSDENNNNNNKDNKKNNTNKMNNNNNNKGRFKKLKKRAMRPTDAELMTSQNNNNNNTRCLGLTQFDDYNELLTYYKNSTSTTTQRPPPPPPWGPSLLLTHSKRNRSSSSSSSDDHFNWHSSPGHHHRDILLSLLFYGIDITTSDDHRSARDRKRRQRHISNNKNDVNDDNDGWSWFRQRLPSSLPKWIRVHNPACTTNVAVIEFCIESPKDVRWAMPSYSSQRRGDDNEATDDVVGQLLSQKGYCGRRALPTKLEIFKRGGTEESVPLRGLSDVLMYWEEPKKATTVGEEKELDIKRTKGDIVSLVEGLLLSPDELMREGYPRRRPPNDDDEKEESTTVEQSSSDDCRNQIRSIATTTSPTTRRHASTLPLSSIDARNIVTSLAIPIIIGNDDNPMKKCKRDKEDSDDTEESYVSTMSLSYPRPVRVFAIDCEMVETEIGPELARVTILVLKHRHDDGDGEDDKLEEMKSDEEYSVVLDLLVKPHRPVLNYLTEYSGITPAMLSNVTTSINDIQAAILTIIDENDILVGHSLENDLRALRLVHGRVVDTAVVFRDDGTGRRKKGRKLALRHLSAVLLNKHIQNKNQPGHCSEEDAATALTLALRRARRGPSFALPCRRRLNIWNFATRARRNSTKNNDKNIVLTRDDGGPLVAIGPDDWIRRHITTSSSSEAHALSCDSINAMNAKGVNNPITSYLKSKTRRPSLLWSHLVVEGESGRECHEKIETFLTHLFTNSNSIPPTTPILFLFQKNYQKASSLLQKRTASNDPRSTLGALEGGWTTDKEEEYMAARNECRMGEALWVGVAGGEEV